MTDHKTPADSSDSLRFAGRLLARAAEARTADMPPVRWKRIHPDVVLPSRGTPGAAGYDVQAYLTGSPVKVLLDGVFGEAKEVRVVENIPLYPGERAILPTGLRVALPAGYVMDVRPRSGTAFKMGLLVPNAPGTIDEDYRGEVGVIVFNPTTRPIIIHHQERIAQFLFFRVEHLPFMDDTDLGETERGDGGFGSTGR